MICLSVSRSPHASARPSSVASISTRRACVTSLKHSSPCPPRPTASPPPTSPLGCAFSANKALFRTAPATLPTISKNSAANRSFSGSPALAGTTHSRPAFAQWPPSWCFATKPSNPCSLPLNLSAQLAARTTRDPSTPTTVSSRLPCTAFFTSSALPLEYRQFFCRASPLSAYQFVLTQRLRCAALRLRRTTDPISAIAYEAGFNDLSTFNRRFQRIMGMTPGSWRTGGLSSFCYRFPKKERKCRDREQPVLLSPPGSGASDLTRSRQRRPRRTSKRCRRWVTDERETAVKRAL